MVNEDFEEVEPIAPPAKSARLTNQQILLGQRHDPIELLRIYSSSEWESFIREWLENLRERYEEVRRATGAGDKGRDIIGYAGALNSGGEWDNYQCKHYDHPLYPSDIWKELAKLCYYTFAGRYSVPRAYYFAAPQGVGPEVLGYLENPEGLRAGLIAAWEKGGLLKVGKSEIRLEGKLLEYVHAFDFGIVKDLPPSKIVEQHRQSEFFAARFGGGLVRLPPDKVDVPADIADHESRYVEQLLQAYADHVTESVDRIEDLQAHPKLKTHFERQRKHFYLAELLRNFTRDNIPEDGCFERLQEAIYDGVLDTAESDHVDGYERIRRTIAMARTIAIDSHPLKECLEGYHRAGICHQLANEDRLTWVP